MKMQMYSGSSIEIIYKNWIIVTGWVVSHECYHYCATQFFCATPNTAFSVATVSFIGRLFYLLILKVTVCDQILICQQKEHMWLLFTSSKKMCSLHLIHCLSCLLRGFRACYLQLLWTLYVIIWWPFKSNSPMSSLLGILVDEIFFLSGPTSSYIYQGNDGALSCLV